MNKNSVRAFFMNKKFKYGGYATIMSAAVIVLVMLANMLVTTLESSFYLRYDATSTRKYSISNQTKKVLTDLDKDITIYLMVNATDEESFLSVSEIINKYKTESQHVTIKKIEPVKNPTFMNKFKSTDGTVAGNGSVVITTDDDQKYRVISYYDLFNYDADGYQTENITENKVTTAIMNLTSKVSRNAYILAGHGEPSIDKLPYVQNQLEMENYTVKPLNLLDSSVEPTKDDVVVIVAPQKDLSDNERTILKEYLKNGGSMFVCFQPTAGILPGFETLIQMYNVKLLPGMIYENDVKHYEQPNRNFLLPYYSDESEITTPLTKIATIMPNSGALTMSGNAPTFVTVVPIMYSTENSWLDNAETANGVQDENEKSEPQVMGVSIEFSDTEDTATPKTRMVVFNSSDFLTGMASFTSYNNEELFANSLAWITDTGTSGIYIRGKTLQAEALRYTNGFQPIFASFILPSLMTLLIFAAAIVIYQRRKHL